MNDRAVEGKIEFIECGDSGQMGVHKHEDGRKLAEWVKESKIGTPMSRKWNDGYADWSDGAAFLVLMGSRFGVDFSKLTRDASDNTEYLTPIFKAHRAAMYDLIEERAAVAMGREQ